MPKQPIATAHTISGKKRLLSGRTFLATVAEEVTVSADVPVPVTLAGAKPHVVPVGSPEQDKVTEPVKELIPLMFTLVSAVCPALTYSEAGAMDIEKSRAILIM